MFMVSLMRKMRLDKQSKSKGCCPMGFMHDGVVECYWFGVVSLTDCAECTVRKDKNIVVK